MPTEALTLLQYARHWEQGLQQGQYKNQRDIAQRFRVSQTKVSYALKAARWPDEVFDFVRGIKPFLQTKQLFKATRLRQQDSQTLITFFKKTCCTEENAMNTPTPPTTQDTNGTAAPTTKETNSEEV
ncbi:MAG: hypothetical protein OXT67_08375 [Zetaproteobacteria bacterium]|nr:hypothetical protein [Zetaproteobacteria bacterium]